MAEQSVQDSNPPRDCAEQPSVSAILRNWRALLTAVAFLTRLPVGPVDQSPSDADLRRSPVFFPLVGGAIGMFTATLSFVGCQIWPPWIAVLVALAAELLLTGAFHEDALADFFDAFGGGWNREEILHILKDSRIGAYGAAALLVGILIRSGCLYSLLSSTATDATSLFFAATIAGAAVSRWTIVLTMSFIAPAPGRESLSRLMFPNLSIGNLAWSSSIAFLPLGAWGWMAPFNCLGAVLVLLFLVPGFIRFVRVRIGGMTGDCLGCACYLTQLVILLAAAAHSP